MHMPIIGKRNRRDIEGLTSGGRKFIDLNDYKFSGEMEDTKSVVRVAEINRLEDLRKISPYIFDGDILILDCTSAFTEDYTIRRITEEVKKLVKDNNGDVAGISKNYLVVTPPGTVIDRNKIKAY